MTLREALALDLPTLLASPLDPVEVAILDSGIDASHPELAGRVVAAYAYEGGAERLAEVDVGVNNDPFGHGTAVASVIARLAPHARFVDYRILGAKNHGTGAALLAAFAAALRRRSPVLNLSLASQASFRGRLIDLCERAYRQGQVVVAAERNAPILDHGFPAELPTAISVGREGFEAPFAFRFRPDRVIEFTARGEDVEVAAAGGGFTRMTGTSFAAPVLSAASAAVVARFPGLRPFEVKAILRAYAEPLDPPP